MAGAWMHLRRTCRGLSCRIFICGSRGYRPASHDQTGHIGAGTGAILAFVNAVDIAAFRSMRRLEREALMQALSWLNEPSDCRRFTGRCPRRSEVVRAACSCRFFVTDSRAPFSASFTGLDASQKEPVFKALAQFGQSLSDAYASLRRNDCLQILKRDREVFHRKRFPQGGLAGRASHCRERRQVLLLFARA